MASNTEKNTAPIEEVEMTQEENDGMLRTYENDILGGLLAAAGYKENEEEIHPVEIAREGTVYFRFHIRPLSEDEYHKCKDKYTKYKRNKQLSIRFPEDTDTVRYRSALIYEATVPEDRAKLWDNKDAWKSLDVLSGVELIGRVLKAGEKDAVLDLIDSISGYSLTSEEMAKN